MSVLIKGMKMPMNCTECRFGSIESCETEPTIIRCIVLNRLTHEVDWHEVCPLIELPPHGDLIDRDALTGDVELITWYSQNRNKDMVEGANSERQAWYKEQDVYEAIENAPIVVEREET